MTGLHTLLARVALGVVAGLAGLLLTSSPRLRAMPRKRFDRLLFGAFALSRVGTFVVVFFVLGILPRGDVQAYYFRQATQVLQHLVPYRDFPSSYAPLHPYLGAALISIWHTPLAIMLFSVLVELLILPVWLRAAREFLPETQIRTASLLYLASPISLQFVALDGQDNVVIALLLGLAVLLVLRSRAAAAGVTFGTSVAAFKFLPLLYAPAFFAAFPKQWRLVAGAALVVGGVYGGFLLLHAPVLQPLAHEGDLRSAGNLPYVIEALLGVVLPSWLTDGALFAVLAGIFLLIGRAAGHLDLPERMRVLAYGISALTLALLVFSKKSWPPYLMLALFPICLLVADETAARQRWKVAAFAVFSTVAVTEHSYWASLLAQFSSMEFHRALVAGEPRAILMMLLEVLLIAGYLWLVWEAVRPLRRRSTV